MALAGLLVGCAPETVKRDPCDNGIFVDADGNAYTDASSAFESAVLLDGVVTVCPGEHDIDGKFGPTVAWEQQWPQLVLRGAGRDATKVSAADSSLSIGVSHPNDHLDEERSLIVESLTIGPPARARSECSHSAYDWDAGDDDECEPWHEYVELRRGASASPYETVVFQDVAFTGGTGMLASAMELYGIPNGGYDTITLKNCSVLDNESSEPEYGGAVLFDFEAYGSLATLTSINTDWGQGETDNSPADVAFEVWEEGATEPDTSRSYSWDGVADFVCRADTRTCE